MADQDNATGSGGLSADISRQIQLQLANLNQSIDTLNTTISVMAASLSTSGTTLATINTDLSTINTTLTNTNASFSTVATDISTINTTLTSAFKSSIGSSSSCTGGAASALPSFPFGYLTATVNGAARKIPYYG